MIHWVWIFLAAWLGVFAGILIAAIAVMARGISIEDEIDEQSCAGCICTSEAVCSKQADARLGASIAATSTPRCKRRAA